MADWSPQAHTVTGDLEEVRSRRERKSWSFAVLPFPVRAIAFLSPLVVCAAPKSPTATEIHPTRDTAGSQTLFAWQKHSSSTYRSQRRNTVCAPGQNRRRVRPTQRDLLGLKGHNAAATC